MTDHILLSMYSLLLRDWIHVICHWNSERISLSVHVFPWLSYSHCASREKFRYRQNNKTLHVLSNLVPFQVIGLWENISLHHSFPALYVAETSSLHVGCLSWGQMYYVQNMHILIFFLNVGRKGSSYKGQKQHLYTVPY